MRGPIKVEIDYKPKITARISTATFVVPSAHETHLPPSRIPLPRTPAFRPPHFRHACPIQTSRPTPRDRHHPRHHHQPRRIFSRSQRHGSNRRRPHHLRLQRHRPSSHSRQKRAPHRRFRPFPDPRPLGHARTHRVRRLVSRRTRHHSAAVHRQRRHRCARHGRRYAGITRLAQANCRWRHRWPAHDDFRPDARCCASRRQAAFPQLRRCHHSR